MSGPTIKRSLGEINKNFHFPCFLKVYKLIWKKKKSQKSTHPIVQYCKVIYEAFVRVQQCFRASSGRNRVISLEPEPSLWRLRSYSYIQHVYFFKMHNMAHKFYHIPFSLYRVSWTKSFNPFLTFVLFYFFSAFCVKQFSMLRDVATS
jgi:hypothetical protein